MVAGNRAGAQESVECSSLVDDSLRYLAILNVQHLVLHGKKQLAVNVKRRGT